MTREEIVEQLKFENPDALFADGFEDALVGIGRQFSRSLALYDKNQCLQILVDRDGMSQRTRRSSSRSIPRGPGWGEHSDFC